MLYQARLYLKGMWHAAVFAGSAFAATQLVVADHTYKELQNAAAKNSELSNIAENFSERNGGANITIVKPKIKPLGGEEVASTPRTIINDTVDYLLAPGRSWGKTWYQNDLDHS